MCAHLIIHHASYYIRFCAKECTHQHFNANFVSFKSWHASHTYKSRFCISGGITELFTYKQSSKLSNTPLALTVSTLPTSPPTRLTKNKFKPLLQPDLPNLSSNQIYFQPLTVAALPTYPPTRFRPAKSQQTFLRPRQEGSQVSQGHCSLLHQQLQSLD